MTFNELRERNAQSAALFANRDDRQVGTLGMLCEKYAKSVPVDDIRRLKVITDSDAILNYFIDTFSPRFSELFTRLNQCEKLPTTPELEDIYKHVCLELLVFGMRGFQKDYAQSNAPSLRAFMGIPYVICLRFLGVDDDDLERQKKEMNEQEQKEYYDDLTTFHCVDHDKQSRAFLAPGEKMRVLRNAISVRNEIGYLIPTKGYREHDFITFDKRALNAALRFFQKNQTVTVNDIMGYLEICADLKFSATVEPGEYDTQWHARRGCDLSMLIWKMEKVLDQLGLHEHYTFLE